MEKYRSQLNLFQLLSIFETCFVNFFYIVSFEMLLLIVSSDSQSQQQVFLCSLNRFYFSGVIVSRAGRLVAFDDEISSHFFSCSSFLAAKSRRQIEESDYELVSRKDLVIFSVRANTLFNAPLFVSIAAFQNGVLQL